MTPSVKKTFHKGLSQTGHLKHNSAHKNHELPKFANSFYGAYQGAYSKSYAPSFDGTFRSRSTAAATNFYSTITVTREADNQQGKDAIFEETRPEIHHPVEFGKQQKRRFLVLFYSKSSWSRNYWSGNWTVSQEFFFFQFNANCWIREGGTNNFGSSRRFHLFTLYHWRRKYNHFNLGIL